jgi:hypothetical protein
VREVRCCPIRPVHDALSQFFEELVLSKVDQGTAARTTRTLQSTLDLRRLRRGFGLIQEFGTIRQRIDVAAVIAPTVSAS